MTDFTPMMKQYKAIKRQFPDAILMFRVGDFYEMFFDDAVKSSQLLQITLTSRQKGEGQHIPMCGVPYHAAETYIVRLIRQGYKVAICEQMEDPQLARGIVRREVTRVITPGVVVDASLLEEKKNNYLMAILPGKPRWGWAIADVSTGEFLTSEIESSRVKEKLKDELLRFKPTECLIPKSQEKNEYLRQLLEMEISPLISCLEDWIFDNDNAYSNLTSHFGVQSLAGFGCENLSTAIGAAGAILYYLQETQKTALPHINRLIPYFPGEYMMLDQTTQRNLELIENLIEKSKKRTLLEVLDKTVTSMGGRLLRSWILKPLLDVNQIRLRQNAVEELASDPSRRQELREIMSQIFDLERYTARLSCGNVTPRDLVTLRESFRLFPQLKDNLSGCLSDLLIQMAAEIDEMPETVTLLDRALENNPPSSLREGGMIRCGYNLELDKLRTVVKDGKEWIAGLQARERERTKINSLKVGYNSIFGYYLEVTKPHLTRVPENYIRKQTLTNAERFITPELKEYESLILGAEEKIIELEYQIFQQLRTEVLTKVPSIQKNARIIAQLDVLTSLAQVAVENGYQKPEVNDNDVISIKDGRHPVVEKNLIKEKFVPNDAYLNSQENQLLIITGPNMAGKSTYLRQVALIVLLAQMGSFVPASQASIGVVDRIFTRVGATDNLVLGQSTFLVEMNETANILNNATTRSLIILDEIGRGTSTYDGVSIAWAVAEYIHNQNRLRAKTLFATHYYELTWLASSLPRVKNYNVAVREWNEEIVFLRKIMEGSADRSYGIQVARLAGLPSEVIQRAKEILALLEQNNELGRGSLKPEDASRDYSSSVQLNLFDVRSHPLVEELKNLDLEHMTPLEALNKIWSWKQKAREENW